MVTDQHSAEQTVQPAKHRAERVGRAIPDAKLAEIIAAQEEIFVRRQPNSAHLAQAAQQHLAGGVTSSWQITAPQPVWLSHGHGSKVYDVDGKEYVDLHGGYGAALAGHAHPAIQQAVASQISRGTHFAQPTPNALAVARELARRFGLPRWRFANSGTEATLRLSVYVTLITVPLGVAFALGINRLARPRGLELQLRDDPVLRDPRADLRCRDVLRVHQAVYWGGPRLAGRGPGSGHLERQLAGLIVQARLVTIGRQYEEAAADLGATPWQVTYRVMMRLLTPAIFASAVLVFSTVIDDFVLVDLLSSNSSNTPMSVYIYSQQRGGNGGPALNALGTIMLVMSFVVAIIGYIGYRWLTRGERGSRIDALTTIASGEG